MTNGAMEVQISPKINNKFKVNLKSNFYLQLMICLSERKISQRDYLKIKTVNK